jgi:hypothetical protein
MSTNNPAESDFRQIDEERIQWERRAELLLAELGVTLSLMTNSSEQNADVLSPEWRASLNSRFEPLVKLRLEEFLQNLPVGGSRNLGAKLNRHRTYPFPQLGGAIAGACIGWKVGVFPFATKAGMLGKWFGRKGTVTLATRIAALGGIPVSIATGGITIVFSIAGAEILRRASAPWRRARLRQLIESDYEQRITPELRRWLYKLIQEAVEASVGGETGRGVGLRNGPLETANTGPLA